MKKITVMIYEENSREAELFQEAFNAVHEDCVLQICQSKEEFADCIVQLAEYDDHHKLPNLIIISLDESIGTYDTRMNLTKTKVLASIPVIVLIPKNTQDEIDKAYTHGACSVIKKPKTREELEQTIKEICTYWIELAGLPNKKAS